MSHDIPYTHLLVRRDKYLLIGRKWCVGVLPVQPDHWRGTLPCQYLYDVNASSSEVSETIVSLNRKVHNCGIFLNVEIVLCKSLYSDKLC